MAKHKKKKKKFVYNLLTLLTGKFESISFQKIMSKKI